MLLVLNLRSLTFGLPLAIACHHLTQTQAFGHLSEVRAAISQKVDLFRGGRE